MGILWSVPLGLWCSYFTCWQFGHLATKSTISRFILLHQKCCFRSRYILVAPGCIEYPELWASVRIVWIKSSTRGTHTLPLILKTPSSSIVSSLASPYNTLSRIRINFSSLNCFPLILSRKEDLASTQANNPPFSFTSNLIKSLARVWTSLANGRLKTCKWAKLPCSLPFYLTHLPQH